jgi:flagellar basal-body rod protein FlgC
MDYQAAFAISASGMQVERLRMEATAVNIANASTTRTPDGVLFRPLRVISTARYDGSFPALMDGGAAPGGAAGVAVAEVREVDVPPRLVFEPGHPEADARGFVSYPGINPVSEMIALMATIRAYEANVVAMNAAKTMALKALDIGRGQ